MSQKGPNYLLAKLMSGFARTPVIHFKCGERQFIANSVEKVFGIGVGYGFVGFVIKALRTGCSFASYVFMGWPFLAVGRSA